MGVAAAIRPPLIDSLRPRDPDLAGLRRAVRAALLMPAAFAVATLLIRDVQVATFVAFGCFALIVMSDFGGLRRERAVAYLVTTLVGAALLTLGTLVSPIPWLAVPTMLVVGFAIQFAGVFGSYAAAAQTALMLAFVLAVSVPAPPGAIGGRLAGWLVAGALSTLAGVFLWPRFEQVRLRRKAALACRSLAELIRLQHFSRDGAEVDRRRLDAAAAVDEARRAYAATPRRPAGPTRRDRAFAELLIELERGLAFAADAPPASRPDVEDGDGLVRAVVDTLQASAEALEGGRSADLLAMTRARTAHRTELNRWAVDSLRSHVPAEQVLETIDADHALRILSYLALALGGNAVIAVGGQVSGDLRLPAGTPRLTGASGVAARIARTVRTHLHPSSSVLHNSLRVGIGLALAVLLAQVLRLDHAFWVVLGTVSVLRTTAMATGRTTLQALAGTLLGFAVGALFALFTSGNPALLWAVLPVTVFLAAYASSAIGFVVSQAAFTLNVIILFNLIAPVGWRVGLARVEDVAVGAAVSVVVSLLLWPRGARGELRRALAALYRASASFVAVSMDRITDGGSHLDAERARLLAIRSRDRAGEAFDQFLNERGAKPLDPSRMAMLVASGTHSIMIGDLLNTIADKGEDARACSQGAEALRSETRAVLETFQHLADRIGGAEDGAAGEARRVSEDVLRSAALRCLKRWKRDSDAGRSAMAVVGAADFIRQLDALGAGLEEPAAAAAAAARVPWWR